MDGRGDSSRGFSMKCLLVRKSSIHTPWVGTLQSAGAVVAQGLAELPDFLDEGRSIHGASGSGSDALASSASSVSMLGSALSNVGGRARVSS